MDTKTYRDGIKKNDAMGYFCFQLVPLWLVNIAVRSGILKLFTNLYSVPFTTLTLDVVKDLTDNEDLQVGVLFCFYS